MKSDSLMPASVAMHLLDNLLPDDTAHAKFGTLVSLFQSIVRVDLTTADDAAREAGTDTGDMLSDIIGAQHRNAVTALSAIGVSNIAAEILIADFAIENLIHFSRKTRELVESPNAPKGLEVKHLQLAAMGSFLIPTLLRILTDGKAEMTSVCDSKGKPLGVALEGLSRADLLAMGFTEKALSRQAKDIKDYHGTIQ